MSTVTLKEATETIRRVVSSSADPAAVIVVAGLPAAGKSSLANSVSRPLSKEGVSLVVLDKDEVAAPFEGLAMNSLTGDEFSRDGYVYRELVLPHTDAVLTSLVRMTYDAGMVALVDRPFIEEANQAVLSQTHLGAIIASKLDRPVAATVWVDVDTDTQYRRMVARGLRRDQAKLADFPSYRDSLGQAVSFNPELCDLYLRLA